ncbi:hypothetical protein [Marinomonas sp.]|uniref:hypothetical protein n=1 Tax=Marinomonas sp. TaxID=1904862 RepID=UPI003A8FA4C1
MLKNDFLTQYDLISDKLSQIDEDTSIYTAIVQDPSIEVVNFLKKIISLELDDPNIFVWYGSENSHKLEYDDLEDTDVCEGSSPWKITLNKINILEKLIDFTPKASLFLGEDSFFAFLEKLDPFNADSRQYDSQKQTFLVNGLKHSLGGEHFYATGINGRLPTFNAQLPSSDDVHNLVHVNTTKMIRVCPRSLSLNQSGANLSTLPNLKRNIAKLLAACLVQELRISESNEEITVKGSKKQTANLSNGVEKITEPFLKLLNDTVTWVYEERSETRLQLIMDRLSLDMNDTDSYLEALDRHLERALEQAKDSYTFVILDRKDDYHKEVRDLIKDMRTQADLYATKTRSLVSGLARDALGILVFFSFSFMARAQRIDIATLLTNSTMSLILHVISAYLAVSIILQLMVHLRDDHLTKTENTHWLKILQNYTKTDDQKQNFLQPIEARRTTFKVAMWIIGLLYLALIYVVYNLQSILSRFIQ